MTAVYYSVSPFGTADIQTGAGNIEVDESGVATFSVAQTGNIGVGCAVEYNSIVSYISDMTDSTHADLVDELGATASSQTSVSLTSIHHVWASRSAAEAAFTGGSFLNTTNLVTGTYSVFLMCYYDHDDQTVDNTAIVTQFGTANATYFLTYRCPRGGTESINDQFPADGVFDANKYVGGNASGTFDECFQDFTVHEFLQYECSGSTSLTLEEDENEARNCIFKVDNCEGIRINDFGSAFDFHIKNCVIYGIQEGFTSIEGVLILAGTGFIDYCTVYNMGIGIELDGGSGTVTNCISFGNFTSDFDGAMTIGYCASEDGTGTNAITLEDGTYAYTNIFTAHTAGDFSLVNNASDANAPQNKGTSTAIVIDIIETARDGSTPDIGAFEFLSAGAAIVKTVLDSVGVTDTASKAISFIRSITNNIGITDTQSRSLSLIRSISDSVGITDVVSKIILLIKSISDSVGITDSQSRKISFIRSIIDSIGVTDNVSRSGFLIIKQVLDSVGITDILAKTLNPFLEVFQKLYIRIFGEPTTIIEIYGEPEITIEINGNPSTIIDIYGEVL